MFLTNLQVATCQLDVENKPNWLIGFDCATDFVLPVYAEFELK